MSYYRDRSPPRGGGAPYKREEVVRRVSIMVRNLPRSISPIDLKYYAEKYGAVKDVYLPKDFHTGEPRGLGFIEFYDERDAEEAVRSMDRMMLGGREISANYAMQGRKRPDDFRGGGGGYRGGGGRDRYDRGRDYGRGYDRGGYDRGDRGDRYDRDRDYDRRDRDRDCDRDRRRSRSRSRSKSPRSRSPERSPVRGRSRSPADRSPARAARSRSATPDRRAYSRSPARSPARSPVRSPARDYSRSPVRANSQD